MKTSLKLLLLAFTVCLALPAPAVTVRGYELSGVTRPVPAPYGAISLNCFLIENDGSYVAVWDARNQAVIERRNASGMQVWQRFIETGTNGENTRVVMNSANRTLWCSPKQFVYLDNATGSIVATQRWNMPSLTPNRAIVQNDMLYFVDGTNAYGYDSNMTFMGTWTATSPQGYWRCYDGAWLIDLLNSTNEFIRVATMESGLVLGETFDIPLPHVADGGYVEHRVLAADYDLMLVASSMTWVNQAVHYFTIFNRGGEIENQTRVDLNASLVGTCMLEDGWMLSWASIGLGTQAHYLSKLSLYGVPIGRVRVATGNAQRYQAINCVPPRVLHSTSATQLELCETQARPMGWLSWFYTELPVLYQVQSPVAAPLGGTNYFWMSSIRLNNTPVAATNVVETGTPTP